MTHLDDIKVRLDSMEAAGRSAFAVRLAAVKEAEELRRAEVDARLSRLEGRVAEVERLLGEAS